MDPSYKPPNLFREVDDDDDDVTRKLDKGKQKAKEQPLDFEPHKTHYRNSYHSQVEDIASSNSDTDSLLDTDSDSTLSPSLRSIDARRIADGDATGGSDGGESLYQSVDEESSPHDQVSSFNSS
ncbi:hypothetical protein OG21DRAFT_684641 [Imleria badia]|nr:hypothetical protein OG21DRAFT_684641 [Imleria badia]